MQNPENFRAAGASCVKHPKMMPLLRENDFKSVKIDFQNLDPKCKLITYPPLFKTKNNKGDKLLGIGLIVALDLGSPHRW